jgi:hypothetical protein
LGTAASLISSDLICLYPVLSCLILSYFLSYPLCSYFLFSLAYFTFLPYSLPFYSLFSVCWILD